MVNNILGQLVQMFFLINTMSGLLKDACETSVHELSWIILQSSLKSYNGHNLYGKNVNAVHQPQGPITSAKLI